MHRESVLPPPAAAAEPAAATVRRTTDESPERWVDEHGDYLFGYARLRLRDEAAAQDVVQETFLAALRGRESYRGTAAERGWLLGILKHKIHDHFRRTQREPLLSQMHLQDEEDADPFVSDGLRQGAWSSTAAPADWPAAPGEGLDREEFWRVFHDCASGLPGPTARAFLLREMDELDSPAICELLGITENHLWVLLHRARLALRRCLEKHWFAKLNA